MAGGETEALQRLKKFAGECQAQPHRGSKDGSHDSIYGANFSCKISPWLAMGCLSPRFMFDELKKNANRYAVKYVFFLLQILNFEVIMDMVQNRVQWSNMIHDPI